MLLVFCNNTIKLVFEKISLLFNEYSVLLITTILIKNNFAKNCHFLWVNKLSHFALCNSNKTQLIYIIYLTVLQKIISRFFQIHCFMFDFFLSVESIVDVDTQQPL